MSTTNYVTAEVSAPVGVDLPSALRLVGHWNATNTYDNRFNIVWAKNDALEIEEPGWDSDADAEITNSDGTRRALVTFWTGGFDYDRLCEGAKKLSARYPGLKVTVSCENSDDASREEDVYLYGRHALAASSHALHTTLTTEQIIARAIKEYDSLGREADIGNWMTDLARRIDSGELAA